MTLVDELPAEAASQWQRYADYKSTPLPWGIKIPIHWRVRRLKHVASVRPSNVDKKSVEGEREIRLCNYVDVYKNDYITSDFDFMVASASESQIQSFALRSGDVIITKDSETWQDIAVPAYVRENLNGVVCGYHLALIRPKPQEIDGEYLFRCFAAEGIADQFRVAANGITRYGLDTGAIAASVFPIPSLDEQRAIAAFLDRETAKIDALVEKKERLIALLAEKRTALISHAVTKGLDPSVPMKVSGIDWLGMIPAHWKMKRLKYVSALQTGLTLGKDYGERRLVSRPYLRVANVQDGYLDLGTITEVQLPAEDVARFELRRGDVLMTEGGDFDKLGRGYVWESQIQGCLHQNHIFAVRSRQNELNPHFLAAMLTSSHGKHYFTSTSQQTTNLASTNSTKLRNFALPVPPIDEQGAILARIREDSERFDSLITTVRSGIGRLREYRTALISAAVTGKIDVRREVDNGFGKLATVDHS